MMLFLLAPVVKVDLFITSDCPICRRYSPEIGRIVRDYPKAQFRLIYSEPAITTSIAKQHGKEFGLKSPFFLDPKGIEARRQGAKIVPTATVWLNGKMTYRGRIDDAYGSDFRWRPAKTRDLRNAITRALTGKSGALIETKPVGCSMSF